MHIVRIIFKSIPHLKNSCTSFFFVLISQLIFVPYLKNVALASSSIDRRICPLNQTRIRSGNGWLQSPRGTYLHSQGLFLFVFVLSFLFWEILIFLSFMIASDSGPRRESSWICILIWEQANLTDMRFMTELLWVWLVLNPASSSSYSILFRQKNFRKLISMIVD